MLFCFEHLIILTSIIVQVECFYPHDATLAETNSQGSKHHVNITLTALQRTFDWFLMENIDLYPLERHDILKNSPSIKSAWKSFAAVVGKRDYYSPYDSDPSYHFTAEKFSEANMIIIRDREQVLNSIKLRKYDAARSAASSLLHTLQDFYSSSNWIEMGNQMIKADLGTTEAFHDIEFASADERTCEDCNDALGECRGNIKRNILEGKKLTSGYFSRHRVNKPIGKCGHGGSTDEFRVRDAIGGINKETRNPRESPHHYHHSQAASLAIDATVDMLKRIYEAIIDDREKFGEFLGIEILTSLCFVIDTTGSMGDEIADVKNMTITLTGKAEGSRQNFVLVPINDPHPNLIHMTNDSRIMIEFLGNLEASGGGDEPEMSISGMLLAAQNVRQGSTCYVFTDAHAKDKDLEETLLTVLTSRNVKMEFLLTKLFGKKKRSTRNERSVEDDYKEIAEVSGGSITMVTKGELKYALKIVEVESQISTVTITMGTLTSNPNVTFHVDTSIKEIFIQTSTITSHFTEITIVSPSGVTINPDMITNIPNLKLTKLSEPVKGQWSVQVGLPAPDTQYSYRIFAPTNIDFSYIFISKKGIPVEFSPIRDEEYYISLYVYGPVNKDTLVVKFISINGGVLKEIKVNHSSSNLLALSILPNDDSGFYVSLHGLDEWNIPFQRINPTIVKTSHVTLELALQANDTLNGKPGQPIIVKVRLANKGIAFDKWVVNIYDSGSYLAGSTNLQFTIPSNESEEFPLNFHIPDDAVSGEVTTVSVAAASEIDLKIKNSLIFYVSVIPEKSDLETPTCKVKKITENSCKEHRSMPCNSKRWNATVKVQDLDSGLTIFKPGTNHVNASFINDIFEKGTNDEVEGLYESNCCFPNVTIVAVDGNGNVGRCVLQVASAASSSMMNYIVNFIVVAVIVIKLI